MTTWPATSRRATPTGALLAALAGLLLPLACASGAGARREVEVALQRYNEALSRTDVDGMAGMFAPDGQLSWADDEPIRGVEAIRAHLRAYEAYRVEESRMTPATQVVIGARARQAGTFWQRTRLPDGKVVEATGRFAVEWSRGADGGWRVQSLATRPP